MTDEELAKAYYAAAMDAQIYGTGFIKVYVDQNGKLAVNVVDPREGKPWVAGANEEKEPTCSKS